MNPPCSITRPNGESSKWPDLLLILLLTFLPFLFFWRLLTPNSTDRMHIAAGDFTEQYFPLRAFTAQEWVNGRLPLWNPYLYGGQPALADIQSGALYPPHVIEALLLGWAGFGFPLWALELQVIAHFALASVGTYLFTRFIFLHPPRFSLSTPRFSLPSLRRARFAAVIAALVFTYGGYLTGFPVQQMTILSVSAWLPWVLWGLSVANERISELANSEAGLAPPSPLLAPRLPLSAIAWGAFAFALAILAGHPQTVLYIFYLSLAYTIFYTIYTWRHHLSATLPSPHHASRFTFHASRFTPHPSRLTLHLIPWFIIIALGAAIAAAQLLPSLEFIGYSVRSDLTYQAVAAGLPLNELISIIYPGFFGGSPAYVGIITLVLIALALLLWPDRPSIFFWAGAALVSLLLAFGGHTFLYPLFYLFAPGFEAVRQQERAFLIYSFSLAVLAGYGALVLTGPLSPMARWRYARFERQLRLVGTIALALTGFYILGSAAATARGDEVNLFYGVLWHHLFGLIILAGTLLLLALRPRRWLSRPWGMVLLALWLGFNLFTINWRFNLEKREIEPFAPNGLVQFLQRATTSNSSFEPARIASGGYLPGGNSAASVFRLEDLTGNTPLQLAAVANFLQQMPSWRLWQLMNVRYVVDQRDLSGPGLTPIYEEMEQHVFELGDPFPRAWFVGRAEVIPEADLAIARLGADDFDLRQAAILAKPLTIPLAEPLTSTIQFTAFSPTRLRADVTVTGPSLLVFSQIYYPGWRATLDGQPVELAQVNVVQSGLVVPAGQHTVELAFNPATFRWGGLISIIGLAIWVLLLIWGHREQRAK